MSEQTQQTMLLNRRQRRQMLRERGVLRLISKMNFMSPQRKQLREQNMENGRKLHQQHVDQIDAKNAQLLEARLEKAKVIWNEQGYNVEEIKLLEEAWSLSSIKVKETYREDKKEAKAIRKKVEELKANRK